MSNEILNSITETSNIEENANVIISQVVGEEAEALYKIPVSDFAEKINEDTAPVIDYYVKHIPESVNLFNGAFDEEGSISVRTGENAESASYLRNSKYNPIVRTVNESDSESKVLYVVTNVNSDQYTDSGIVFNILFYDKNKTYLSYEPIRASRYPAVYAFALSNEAAYFRIYTQKIFYNDFIGTYEGKLLITTDPKAKDTANLTAEDYEYSERMYVGDKALTDLAENFVSEDKIDELSGEVDRVSGGFFNAFETVADSINIFADNPNEDLYEPGYINVSSGENGEVPNGTVNKSFKRTNRYAINKGAERLYVRLSEPAVTSFTVILYKEGWVSGAEDNKKHVARLALKTDTSGSIALDGTEECFRISTNANFSGKVIVATEEIPENFNEVKFSDSFANDIKGMIEKNDRKNKISKLKNSMESLDLAKFEKTYYVGQDKDFKTIGAALAYWQFVDNFAPAVVYISNGTYTFNADDYMYDPKTYNPESTEEKKTYLPEGYSPVLFVDSGKNISFIGESREGVILRTTTGDYINAPIFIRHGNVQIKNMTVIADHSEKENFSYFGDPLFDDSQKEDNKEYYGEAVDGLETTKETYATNAYKVNEQGEEMLKDGDKSLYITLSKKIPEGQTFNVLLYENKEDENPTRCVELESKEERNYKISVALNPSDETMGYARYFALQKSSDFDVKTYVSDIGAADKKAYAIHIDGGNNGENPGKVLVENVTAISYQAPAFGMGLIPNSTIRLQNCKCISFTEPVSVYSSGGVSFANGSLFCHKSSYEKSENSTRNPERLELVDVEVYSHNGERSIKLSNGIVVYNRDIKLKVTTTDENGNPKTESIEISLKNLRKRIKEFVKDGDNKYIVTLIDGVTTNDGKSTIELTTEYFDLLASNCVLVSGVANDNAGDFYYVHDPELFSDSEIGKITGGKLMLDSASSGNTCEELNV